MDPISNMLNTLKNAALTGKPSVVVPYSNFKNEIAKVLEKEGFLKRANQLGKKNKKYLECFIAYNKDGEAKLTGLRRVSKQSRRVYAGGKELPSVKNGRGLAIVSTPKGLLTDKEARAAKVGGEILVEVW